MSMRFAYPSAWLLLLPLVFTAWRMLRRNRCPGLVFSALARLPLDRETWRTRLCRLPPAALLAGLLLLVVASARPQTLLSSLHREVDALAVAMVVDVSGSMRALDFSESNHPRDHRSRLDVVKETFAEFIDQRPDDLIALLTFGGFVATRSPLTSDHNALRRVLETVRIPDEPREGGRAADSEELLTAIGDALATACARLRDAEPKTRIVVLLSDGESNAGIIEPDEAADIAARLGIRIYTIGVGTTGEAPFPARDIFGRETVAYGRVTIDEETLRRIAANTNGKYFNVRDDAGLHEALDDINQLETTRVSQDVYTLYREHYLPFAAAGASLSALGALLSMLLLRRPV